MSGIEQAFGAEGISPRFPKRVSVFSAMVLFSFSLGAFSALFAETCILDRTAAGRTPIDAEIPLEAITSGDRADGEISLWITATNEYTGWTWALPSRTNDLYITDGEEKMPLLNPTNPTWGDLGPKKPGVRCELKFNLPQSFQAKTQWRHKKPSLRICCPKGVFCWGGSSHGDFRVESWKGIRAEVKGWVDAANRCGFVDMKDVPAERYVFSWRPSIHMREGDWRPPRIEQTGEVFRVRMQGWGGAPLLVDVEAYTRKDGVFRQTVELVPHARPLEAPFPPGEVVTGHCVYGGDRRFADEIVTNELADLIVSWNKFNTLTGMPASVRSEFDRKGMRFMTIYGYDRRDLTDKARDMLGTRYLCNNVGELAGYLYQGPREAAAVRVPQGMTDLGEAKDRFVNVFMQRFVRARHQDYDFIFSTSGSPLGCYELQGGMDFMCNELYAVGSANLAYATSEARGAARKWKPEFWGGWLAEEWQTFTVPYSSAQKYDLLKAGLYQQYLMGTSLIVLESGAQSTQAHEYTSGAKGEKQGYDGHAPKEYRRTVKEFRDWTKANPRDPSGPATCAAFVMGNHDGFVGMSFPSFAIWAQHATASNNVNWRCGAPESTWHLAKEIAFPLVEGALAPYPNHWLAGTPFGQVDVVQVDNEVLSDDISRYSLLVYAGWNTMTPRIAEHLTRWVQCGGELFLCLPHLSVRTDREAKDYRPSDLVGGGDLSAFGFPCRVTGRADGGGFDVATVDKIPTDAKVLAKTPNGHPLVIERGIGKGRIRLMLSWEYPGKGGIPANTYKMQVAEMLSRHTAEGVKVSGPDATAVSWAVYRNTLYLLNMDCVKPRTVTLELAGEPRQLTLAPCEMCVVNRKCGNGF